MNIDCFFISADVYLNMENSEEAANCILEASSIFPVSPEVLCMVSFSDFLLSSQI